MYNITPQENKLTDNYSKEYVFFTFIFKWVSLFWGFLQRIADAASVPGSGVWSCELINVAPFDSLNRTCVQ